MSVAVFIDLHLLCDVCRLRFFNQLEDELQSHQQEEQWLRDKGQQLAQRDAELGGEVLREISLLQTTWEDTKKLITERWATRKDLLYFFVIFYWYLPLNQSVNHSLTILWTWTENKQLHLMFIELNTSL